jgi:hypothetical protein
MHAVWAPEIQRKGAPGPGRARGDRKKAERKRKKKRKEQSDKRRTYLPTFFGDFCKIFKFFLNIVMVLLSSSCRKTAGNTINKSKGKNYRKKHVPFWGPGGALLCSGRTSPELRSNTP